MINKSGRLTSDQQLAVLKRIWGTDKDMGGYVFLPWIPGWTKDKADRRRNWNEGPAFNWPFEANKVLAHIAEHQRDDLYFSVNKFLQPARVAQHVGESFALYADLDEVNPRTDIDSDMRPSIAWESSPDRFQGIWLMQGMEWDASAAGGYNHRMSAAIGADPSGWDVTQVLRVPGKDNYKFDYKDEDGKPVPGRLLWFSQKRYSWSFMEKRLAPVKTYDTGVEVDEAELDHVDRHAVWARVRLKCSHTVRTFMAMKTREVEGSEHDRSGVLWQIERDLADAGCTVAEIMSIVRGTPWNKYSGRRNELAQLRAEALKALGVAEDEAGEESLEGAAFDGTRPDQPRWFSNIAAERIKRPNWLVRNIWTAGSCGFISGQPKSYKSYFALDMAFSVSMGMPFLNDSQFSTRQGKVLYLQEEDSLPLVMMRAEQIIEQKAPGHHWHGQLTMPQGYPDQSPPSGPGTRSELMWTPPIRNDALALHVRTGFISSDPAWQSWLAEFVDVHKFDLVIIDTLGTTVGDIDTDKAVALNERVLKPLKLISDKTKCAIAIVHHNRKTSTDGTRSGQQMLGSVALHAWVESALYVQSKEKLTNSDAEVKVERENKLAEDFKFRVRIPPMWVEKGDDEQGARQMWEPAVLIGWAQTQDGDAEVIADDRIRASRGPAGSKIAEVLSDLGEGWHLFAEINIEHGQNQGATRKQLNFAVTSGLIQHKQDTDMYRMMG